MSETFTPGPNLRIANNDSGMSLLQQTHQNFDASMARLLGTEPVLPENQRKPRAERRPLPENPTLQDRLRRYNPISGYARVCNEAADRIDQLEKELQASRNLNMSLNGQITALKIANEALESDQQTMLRAHAALNRIVLQSSRDAEKQAGRAFIANERLAEINRRGFWTRIYHAFKGEK